MSVRKKKAGLVISWQRSISILAPWRKGKGDRDAVLDSEVVLTKMKFFTNFHEKLLTSVDSASSEQDVSHDHNTTPEVNSRLNEKPTQLQTDAGSEFLPGVFSDSQLPRLYKFESDDSGVDLPSGANSPSTPTGSEQSFVVHSRESSCLSCNLTSDPNALPDEQAQNSEMKQAEVEDQDDVLIHSEELCSPAETEDLHGDGDGDVHVDGDRDGDGDGDEEQFRASGNSPEGGEEISEELEENRTVTQNTCTEEIRCGQQSLAENRDDAMARRKSATSDSLEDYMDECCRLSEEFVQQQCICGAASLVLQPVQKRLSRSEYPSLNGTLSDLSTIPEVTQHPLIPTTDVSSESLTSIPLWRRSLNRRSYTEGEVRCLGDSAERLSYPQRRQSENHTWGRVKDLVRKTKLRNQSSRLGLSSASLKMSCPQLYRPDLGPVEPAGRNRNSMIVLGHQSKLDFPWLP
ncbi:uncharacterized protein si:ch211-250c4.3 [Solea solea]|uniref:uncharacterized protein si:ch211-250c4.3 n=1 Tax=Solea solea TaxID=90069 RepID=UPI00272C7E9E|nr:uncharacterized protein si:ch211-250c4.3 [Solea solea]